MTAPRHASAPDAVSIEGRESDLAGRLIKANSTPPVKPRPLVEAKCMMACSLPIGSCAYRCPVLGGAA
jgi:hypothetical protein